MIQDEAPAKNVAWKQALERHEAEVAKTKDFNKKVVHRHFQQVKSDEDQNQLEFQVKQSKKQRFYEDIHSQMNQNVRLPLLLVAL